eukprot:Polyplicarium_translucidae@DN3272_c0_g1_i6.p1
MKTAAVFFVVLLQLGAHAVDCGLYSYSPGFRNNWCRDYCLGSEWGADAPDFCHSQPCSSRVKANARSFSTASEPNEASCQDSCQARADCAAYLYDCQLICQKDMGCEGYIFDPSGPLCGIVPTGLQEVGAIDLTPGLNPFGRKFCAASSSTTPAPGSPAPCSTPVSSDPQSFTNLFSGIPDEEACLVWCNGVIECEAYVYDPPNQRCALLDATQMEAVDFTPGPFVFGPHCGEDPSPSVPDPLLCGEPRMDVCVPPLQEIVGVPCRLRAAASVKS